MQEDDRMSEKIQTMLSQLLESNPFQILVTLLTLYALFGDDIRVAAFRQDADIGFDALNIICLVYIQFFIYHFFFFFINQIVFSFEIILSVICKKGYFLSFFFWLDTISTLSLLLDIQLFNVAVGLSASNGATNTASLARAGRASRVGTKAGRVVRLVRLIRLVKLYKTASKKEDKIANALANRRSKRKYNTVEPSQLQQKTEQIDEQETQTEESKVSKILSDLTTKKVIIVVLILLFIIPLFDTNYYLNPPPSMQVQVEIFIELAQSNYTDRTLIKNTYQKIINDQLDSFTPIVSLNSPLSFDKDFPAYIGPDYANLRSDELDVGSSSFNYDILTNNTADFNTPEFNQSLYAANNSNYVVGMLSLRTYNVLTAILSIVRTLYVSAVLTFGALMFSKDANDLALRPLERMIDKVKKMANDPQSAVEQQLIQNHDNNETVKIENTIIKIGTLLALGYGEAGTEIIKMNMQRQGDVDPMIPGVKKAAIYGFCDIRNFTDATEVLQEDVMVFVNNIGDIVHTVCDRYMGSANKNIGDAFLLVWKIDQATYQFQEDNIIWNDKVYISKLADCALISFMKIQCKINREPKILAYRKDKRLQSRMDNYKVKMGLGLHLGWGIEGAIGSNFKIDASYLSPNVNMAARLEAATKQYGVPLLISNSLQEQFSSAFAEYVRQIDKVTVKGSIEPIGLFTIDMYVDNLPPSTDPKDKYPDFSKDDCKQVLRLKKQDFKEYFYSSEYDTAVLLQENKDLAMILKPFNKDFHNLFGQAFQKYIQGDWKEAKQMFQEASKFKANDGPTETLLSVMSESNFQKPNGWKGYRELTEK